MKNTIKLFITCALFGTLSFSQDNAKYQKYDTLFDEISKQRHGLSDEKISKIKSPFIVEKKVVKLTKDENGKINNVQNAQEVTYELFAILQNRVNINKNWYKINDTVNGYKIIKINQNSVVLDNAGNKLKLRIKKGKDNVIITTN